MKKLTLLFILIIFFISPAFSLEDEDTGEDSVIENEVEKYNFSPKKKKLKPAQVRPKREQKETIEKNNKSLSKLKIQFEKRVENELRLLQDEYDILEYEP